MDEGGQIALLLERGRADPAEWPGAQAVARLPHVSVGGARRHEADEVGGGAS
jgi:hypothetical protein